MGEILFDLSYLTAALFFGLFFIFTGVDNGARTLAGVMALVLVIGDAFHLLPRIWFILNKGKKQLHSALGRGKQVTSITMTIFYLLLWQLGILLFSPSGINAWTYAVYAIASIRIIICLFPQNNWRERFSPQFWVILRNIPFLLLGGIVAGLFFIYRLMFVGFSFMWLAIALSFVFYIPVAFWTSKNPKIGILMLPKTCAYIWMLIMCLSL